MSTAAPLAGAAAPPEEIKVDTSTETSTVAVKTEAESSTDKPVPAGFVVHTESTTSILFASPTSSGPAPVFLNPVQEYNRDLSIVAIRTWSEQRQKERAALWEKSIRKKWAKEKGKRKAEAAPEDEPAKKLKAEDGAAVVVAGSTATELPVEKASEVDDGRVLTPPKFKFTILEALSATGLRAIRYAKEIPLLKYVVANDLSASAVEDIRRNIAFNDLAPVGAPPTAEPTSTEPTSTEPIPTEPTSTVPPLTKAQLEEATLGKVRVNEGDACVYMYNHRTDQKRFDCVDLDPYGSAVPFLDAAIGAVADGGLICVTCTDAAVLAGHNYPEKAYTHYGGVCVNAEYSHEVGIRLVLNAIAATAGRYGRNIEPLLSLSIDFYLRVFVRITTSPKDVKALPSKTSLLYYCHDCQMPWMQPMGRQVGRASAKTGDINYSYHTPSGPPPGAGDRCGECGGKYHIGGPMWGAPIHNLEFVEQMLEHVEKNPTDFGTTTRIVGMLSVAKAEVADAPLYFTPGRLCGFFHCIPPSISIVASALLNGGFSVSRSHALAGSLKTNAPRAFVMDIIREWIKLNPVKTENIKEGAPASRLLAKAQTATVDLTHNPGVEDALMSKVKLVRYQLNPLPNWGPAKAAVKGGGKKKGEAE
ncbi:hypothetical protein RQP46_007191 [Phenoliferia psychrophenolica]